MPIETKGDKLFVYGANHAPKRFACQYYRIDVPLRSLEKLGLAFCWNDRREEGPDRTIQAMTVSDFNIFWGITGQRPLEQLQILKEMKPTVRDGETIIPPTLILDTDDNRDYIHPFNTSYCTQGIRAYPETRLLVPGETVSTTGSDGKKIDLWVDKQTECFGDVFDIERNLQTMKLNHQIMHTVHGMTTASPVLARYYKEVIGVKNVYFFPNTIIPSDYESFDLVPKQNVRILWQGGMSHFVDWYPLRDAVREVTRKYPNTTWVIFGEQFDWITDIIPESQLELHPWVDYSAYKLKRALLQIDINLCPLADNLFNRCKSAIKWYEASVWKNPEATLAAKVPPFSDEMTDGENGLLYTTPQDFVEKLSVLIEDKQLRLKLSKNAKEWVLKNRVPEVTVPPLFEYYKELRQERIHNFLKR